MAIRELDVRKGGGKLSRSEVVTVRLDPKLRYMAELAARMQRRTLSSFVEWAVERTLGSMHSSAESSADNKSVWDEADSLWDVDEADRLANLALLHPEWLTHDEQVLWKLIRENGFLWRGTYARDNVWTWDADEASLLRDRLRQHWQNFVAASKGDAEAKAALPTWAKKKPPVKPAGKFDDMDDEIPF